MAGAAECNPPFFPAWSSQFSKVQGPQAPQGDTWQSIGQGTWQSWEVLGTGPWHRRFSTGRDAAKQQERSKVMSKKPPQKPKPALLSSYSGSVGLQPRSLRGSWWWDEGVEGSFAFIPGSHCHFRDQRCEVVEIRKKKTTTIPTKQGCEVDTSSPCFLHCLPVSLSEWWISNDYLASPHRAVPATWSTVELCPAAIGADRKKDDALQDVQRQHTMTTPLFYSRRWPIFRCFRIRHAKKRPSQLPCVELCWDWKGGDVIVALGSVWLTAEQLNTVAISKSDIWTS